MGLPTQDRIAAEHETAHAGKPWVLVRKHALQPGLISGVGRMYFNVVGGAIREGSTVSIEGLLKQGYRVEVVD